ncbi:MAG: hypothetical protein HQM09_20385 [Candidatus Riflebacteria bacterium]|nr:hypothetical protein [Candidatus Riflebacteria bacterium]
MSRFMKFTGVAFFVTVCICGVLTWRVVGTLRWAMAETIVWSIDDQCERYSVPASETARLHAIATEKSVGIASGNISIFAGYDFVRCLQRGAGHGALLLAGFIHRIQDGTIPVETLPDMDLINLFSQALRDGRISDITIASFQAILTTSRDVTIRCSSGLVFHETASVLKTGTFDDEIVSAESLMTEALSIERQSNKSVGMEKRYNYNEGNSASEGLLVTAADVISSWSTFLFSNK